METRRAGTVTLRHAGRTPLRILYGRPGAEPPLRDAPGSDDWDGAWLAPPCGEVSERELGWIDDHIALGKPAVVVLDERDDGPVTDRLLRRLAAPAVADGGAPRYSARPAVLRGPGVEGEHLVLAGWARISVTAGEPWVWVDEDGARFDIARRFPASEGRGEVIVFYQSRFWRTEFGGGTDGPADPREHDAWELQWLALDHLCGASLLPPTPAPVGA